MKHNWNTIDSRRVRVLRDGDPSDGPVIYWMSRDQRVRDNWGLVAAQELSIARQQPLLVAFNLVTRFLGATIRHYDFMLAGLEEVASDLAELRIPFRLLMGTPEHTIPALAKQLNASALVVDFSPLREPRRWREEVAERLTMPVFEVDAHNIVPCWVTSDKQEYAAYTIRPKIQTLLPEFLVDIPRPVVHPVEWRQRVDRVDWQGARRSLDVDMSVAAVQFPSGESAALAALDDFLEERFALYHELSNDPAADGQSDLSPFLHFGQLSAHRVALAVHRPNFAIKPQEAFLEQLIVRRELAENFCYYNRAYDSVEVFPDWAKETLRAHACDPRPYLYNRDQFEQADTHDDIWNTAQKEVVTTGKMHGYLRMYWAKKILEWTRDPAEAMEVAIYLNDRYELDGRDPNGYAGVAWSVGGVHDRAFAERAIFGKIRYMSDTGCRRKFDMAAYVSKVREISREVTS